MDRLPLMVGSTRVTFRRQNEQNFQNRGNGISEIEGKAARVAASEVGAERVSIEETGFPR